MNDELSAQLTGDWTLPEYARPHLWVEGISGAARCEGQYGLFQLEAPSPELTVYWGDVDNGAALATLPWQADSLGWDGHVKLGGYVDAVHITTLPGTDLVVNIVTFGGQPLRAAQQPYAAGSQRGQQVRFKRAFYDGLVSDIPESFSTWLVADDNPLAQIMQNAAVENLRLHCYGQMADDAGGWHHLLALPIMLEAVTLFPS